MLMAHADTHTVASTGPTEARPEVLLSPSICGAGRRRDADSHFQEEAI